MSERTDIDEALTRLTPGADWCRLSVPTSDRGRRVVERTKAARLAEGWAVFADEVIGETRIVLLVKPAGGGGR